MIVAANDLNTSPTYVAPRLDFTKGITTLPWIVVATLIAIFLFAYYPYHQILEKIDFKTSRTVVSAVLLVGMTGLYFHASKFYRDQFYLFVSLAWLGNLVYLVFDLGAPISTNMDYPKFRSLSMLLAIATDLPFYIAGATKPGTIPKYKTLLVPLLAIGTWFGVNVAGFDGHTSSAIHTCLATAFASYVAFRVYRAFSWRIEKPSVWNRMLKYSFFAFAVIQPTFLLVFSSQLRFLVKYILSLALVFKLSNAVALAVMLRDDFGRLRAEAEMTAERLSQRSEFEEIGLLTASIEHELRTPLGALNTKLHQMKEEYQGDPHLALSLDFLDGQRVRILAATRIINTLRSSQEYFSERMETVKVVDLVRKSVKDLKNEEGIITEGVSIKVEEHLERLFVKAYPPLLEQAFVNIIKNSVEAIRTANRQSREVKIIVNSLGPAKDSVIVSFQDNGCGLPEEDIERLTNAGFSTKGEDKQNRGLGLFVCERIVRLHNGRLMFEEAKKSGAIVSIVLPRLILHRENPK
jgi:signal transduction histidine kinase